MPLFLGTTLASVVRLAAGGCALRASALRLGTFQRSVMSEAVTGASGTDEYVRLRAGKDGGRFVVPAACLMEMSATMKGIFPTPRLHGASCMHNEWVRLSGV